MGPSGALASAPSVASWGPGRLDVFGVDADGQLQHASFAGAWSGWEALGGDLDPHAAPTVIARQPGVLDIIASGRDRAVWHMAWDGAAWTSWESLGGNVKSPPGGDDSGGTGGDDAEDRADDSNLLGGCSSAGTRGGRLALVSVLVLAFATGRRRRRR